MTATNLIRLLSLAAIWGSSFLFMRVGAPTMGAVWLVETRVGLAALFLAAVSVYMHQKLQFRSYWKHYMTLGFFNAVLPFALFSYAAQILSASLLSILNATAPIWGAVIVAVMTRQALAKKTIIGLLLGVAGVALLVGFDEVALRSGAAVGIICALGAACSYGISSTYARTAKGVSSFSNAHGSMWAATLILLPVLPFFSPSAVPDTNVVMSIVALGVLCSGIAFLLYFRLIEEVGAPSALTVAFLIPIFGVLWGHLFLGEAIGWYTIVGSLIVMTGTALVTGFNPRTLFRKNMAAE